jgi:hypothetical protein
MKVRLGGLKKFNSRMSTNHEGKYMRKFTNPAISAVDILYQFTKFPPTAPHSHRSIHVASILIDQCCASLSSQIDFYVEATRTWYNPTILVPLMDTFI